jgi:hypothetical protein
MADVLNGAPVKLAPEIVRAVARDPELRALRPGSQEYKSAFEKKFPNKNESTESETVAREPTTQAKTEVHETSTDDERTAISKKVQKRFDKLTAERDGLRARIAELEKAGATPKQAEKQAEAETKPAAQSGAKFDKPKPKASEFKGANALEDYTEAVAEWTSDKRDFEREQKARAKAADDSRTTSVNKFFKDGEELGKEMGLNDGDFTALVNDDGVKKYPETLGAILESPFAAHIALELANLDDAVKEKISKMTPVQQVAYIGKLEAKAEAKAEAKSAAGTRTISGAKAPGKSLQKGSGGTNTKAYSPGMDFKSYEQMRKEQRPEKFRR